MLAQDDIFDRREDTRTGTQKVVTNGDARIALRRNYKVELKIIVMVVIWSNRKTERFDRSRSMRWIKSACSGVFALVFMLGISAEVIPYL